MSACLEHEVESCPDCETREPKDLELPGAKDLGNLHATRLQFWAPWMAARFAAPVYLVGSAVEKEGARDVDIWVILEDAQFERRYRQKIKEWTRLPCQKWIDDVAKISRGLVFNYHINADLKVVPESFAAGYPSQKRILLSRPNA
jgi:hypothetical protein